MHFVFYTLLFMKACQKSCYLRGAELGRTGNSQTLQIENLSFKSEKNNRHGTRILRNICTLTTQCLCCTNKTTLEKLNSQYCVKNIQNAYAQRLVIIRLTFRHRASSVQDRHFATLQRTRFISLINKYILLSDICLTVHH